MFLCTETPCVLYATMSPSYLFLLLSLSFLYCQITPVSADPVVVCTDLLNATSCYNKRAYCHYSNTTGCLFDAPNSCAQFNADSYGCSLQLACTFVDYACVDHATNATQPVTIIHQYIFAPTSPHRSQVLVAQLVLFHLLLVLPTTLLTFYGVTLFLNMVSLRVISKIAR